MTRSVYIIGGAGAGKSTFTAELLADKGFGSLQDLYMKRNAKGTPVTLRGHDLSDGGLYIGCMRDSFPGTDGLDRASSIAGEAWLEAGGHNAYPYIVAEGSTLATRRFISALETHTELLVVHLWVDPMIADLRFLQRGSEQDDRFVTATVTRSANLAREIHDQGVRVQGVDTESQMEWAQAKSLCKDFLETTSNLV